MTLRTYPDLVQGADEWLRARSGIVTASIVGRLITSRPPAATEFTCPECQAAPGSPCASKRSSNAPIKTIHGGRTEAALTSGRPDVLEPAAGDVADGITATLVAERLTGYVEETRMNADMWRGVEEEPYARLAYAEHHAPVHEIGFMVRDDWGFLLGWSPDGLVGEHGAIEIKSRRQKTQLGTILDDAVPQENMAQLQAALLVSGREWIDYVSFCGGMPLWVKRVHPDTRWFAAILAAVERFESTAEDMVARYESATSGLPVPPRPQLEMVI